MKRSLTCLIASLGFGLAMPTFADPPGHAPAHGWRDKHDHHPAKAKHKHHPGKSGVVYSSDYGISGGRCNRDQIGAVLGAATGAAIGGSVTDRDDRAVGVVVGAIAGAVLGNALGDAMDDRDRACMGHALELGRSGMPVVWQHSGQQFSFTPGRDARRGCRYATLELDGKRPREVLACPAGRGEWRLERP